jgi:mannose-1-phosphate guanylyltransferase/phosphomannomutase
MIAIILPTADTKNLSPLTDSISESLLPIANKPILEHQIEFFAQQNIKEIVVVLKHKHLQVEKYFGCGERWGVKLKFVFEKRFQGELNTLNRFQHLWKDTIVCLPGNILTNLDLTQLLKVHKFGKSDITLCQADINSSKKQVDLLNKGLPEQTPFVIEPGVLPQILKQVKENSTFPESNKLAPKISIFNSKSSEGYFFLDSTKDYWEINQQSLEGKIDGLIIKGKEISKNVWIGAHSEVHPKAVLKAPLLIGDHCVVNKDVVIEGGSIIGDNSIIEEGTSVSRSVVWKGTYAGAQTQIADSVVNKNHLFHIPRRTMVQVSEPFILGDSEPELSLKIRKLHPTKSLKVDSQMFSFLTRIMDMFAIRFNLFKANLKMQKKEKAIVS